MAATTGLTYETIENPYNDKLEREDRETISDEGVEEAAQPADIGEGAVNGDNLDDIKLKTDIASSNYKPGSEGFELSGKDGTAEFNDIKITGGAISGAMEFNIPDETTANSWHVDSVGNMWFGCNVADFIALTGNAKIWFTPDGFSQFTEDIEILYSDHTGAGYIYADLTGGGGLSAGLEINAVGNLRLMSNAGIVELYNCDLLPQGTVEKIGLSDKRWIEGYFSSCGVDDKFYYAEGSTDTNGAEHYIENLQQTFSAIDYQNMHIKAQNDLGGGYVLADIVVDCNNLRPITDGNVDLGDTNFRWNMGYFEGVDTETIEYASTLAVDCYAASGGIEFWFDMGGTPVKQHGIDNEGIWTNGYIDAQGDINGGSDLDLHKAAGASIKMWNVGATPAQRTLQCRWDGTLGKYILST